MGLFYIPDEFEVDTPKEWIIPEGYNSCPDCSVMYSITQYGKECPLKHDEELKALERYFVECREAYEVAKERAFVAYEKLLIARRPAGDVYTGKTLKPNLPKKKVHGKPYLSSAIEELKKAGV
ncbi:MAG: hypothetical protein KAT46_05315 [Deltaproteobacteria bacterium]|nr:hypothetical protein [Deltaproteobacteria bacterium]